MKANIYRNTNQMQRMKWIHKELQVGTAVQIIHSQKV